MKNDESNYVPNYDSSDWRVGFEVEMVFGDLGLKRYREMDEAFDVASLRFCKDIAARLSKHTGVEWTGTYEPQGLGYFVTPEGDLDPIAFSPDAVGGVELITPPLPLAEAETLRQAICETVTETMSNGLLWQVVNEGCGWHINVDRGEDARPPDPALMCCGLWEGSCELDTLFNTERYFSDYASPQHHGYGPAMIRAMDNKTLPLKPDDLTQFLYRHAGRSKKFAVNFAKLDRNYVELRHFGLEQFLWAILSKNYVTPSSGP